MIRGYLYIIISLFVLLNFYLLFKLKEAYTTFDEVVLINGTNYQNNLEQLKNLQELIKQEYQSINVTVNPRLKDFIDDEDKLIVYFNESDCSSCVIELFNYVDQLGDLIGESRIVLVGNFESETNFNALLNSASFNFSNIFCIEDTYFPKNLKKPCIFILDINFKIKLFFLPDNFPDLKEYYFTTILPDYFIR